MSVKDGKQEKGENLVPFNRIVSKNQGPKTIDVKVAVERIAAQADPVTAKRLENWLGLVAQYMANQTAQLVHLAVRGVAMKEEGNKTSEAILAFLQGSTQTLATLSHLQKEGWSSIQIATPEDLKAIDQAKRIIEP